MPPIRIAALVLFLCLCFQQLFSQVPSIRLKKRYGGSDEDRISSVTQLSNGNYICAGETASTDGQGTGNHGMKDFMLTCTSDQGDLIWSKTIGGSNDDGQGWEGSYEVLSPTSDGGFFFAGTASSSDGDIIGFRGENDIFLARMDTDGNILWKKNYGGNKNDMVAALQTTPDGGCIVIGSSISNNNGDVPALHNIDNRLDVWVFKINSSGSIEWSKTYGGENNDVGQDIALTSDGGYIFTADITSIQGDPAPTYDTTRAGGSDIWVVKLTSTGDITWQKRIGGSANDNGARVIQSSNGDFVICGSTYSVNGDFSENLGISDMALARLSPNGSIIYIRSYGGFSFDAPWDLVETEEGDIITGVISFSTQLNGLRFVNRGESDVVLVKTNGSNGNIRWINSFGGNLRDPVRNLLINHDEELVVAGLTASNDYDFTGSLGDYDGFFMILSNYNLITGAVYNDANGNGIRDAGENYINNVAVASVKTGGYSITTRSENGLYRNETDSGTFITRAMFEKPEYFTQRPDSFITHFPGYYGKTVQDIGIQLVPGKKDLQSIIVAETAARAGRPATYKLICFNIGTETIAAGTVYFVKDQRTTYVPSLPAGSISGDTLSLSFSNLKPFDTLVVRVQLTLGIPPDVQGGDWLTYKSLVTPTEDDLQPADNAFTLYHIVTGPRDPNDKSESHGDFFSNLSLKNKEAFNYTIRFQNVGTDTAFQVVIRDTIDARLDISTLRVLSSSYPATLKIEGNTCTWNFADIMLPDSTHNEPASHGYIAYSIQPLKPLGIGDTVYNSASIYFDFELPVKTNTCTTIVRLPVPPVPRLSAVDTTLCSLQGSQTLKLLNIPGADYQVSVEAKLDGHAITIAADSSLIVATAVLNAGTHSLQISYANTTDTASLILHLQLSAAATPAVKLQADKLMVAGSFDSVHLTAQPLSGYGDKPQYVFAKDKALTQLYRSKGLSNRISIPASVLKAGSNSVYVMMETSDTCVSAVRAIDSVSIEKIIIPPVTGEMFIVTPSPIGDELIIKRLNPATGVQVRVYDLFGRLVLIRSSKGESEIRVRHRLATGLYVINIYTEQGGLVRTFQVLRL